MLIYSENRLVPTDVNMMVIAGMGGYFYIHRALYDQAVILDDIYGEEHETLIKAVTNATETRPDVESFFAEVPKPINIFAPFLLLVKEEFEDIVDMIGAIHAMSGPMNLRKMLKVPFEMRNTPSFSLSIKDEYQLAWDRFFLNTMPYGTQLVAPVAQPEYTPMNGTQTTTVPVEGELSNIGEDGQEYADPLEALLFGCGDDPFGFNEPDADDTPAPTSEQNPEPAPVSTPAPAPVQEEVVQPTKKIESGIDLLKGGLV